MNTGNGNSHERPADPALLEPDRELILKRLALVDERVNGVELAVSAHAREHSKIEEAVSALAREFNELAGDVRKMMLHETVAAARDAEIERTLGLHGTRLEQFVARAGGQVGGITGAASGTEAARDVGKRWKPMMVLISMVVAAVTGGVASGIIQALQTVKPVPAAIYQDQETKDRVTTIEHELKKLSPPPPSATP